MSNVFFIKFGEVVVWVVWWEILDEYIAYVVIIGIKFFKAYIF